ncbi:winged helix DNA-binding domain-containing protein [Lentzea tibetensis]|uniref:Winged helix DNA-binding domain-containing protein n=1 Tax=Lentzea tibetensis TaxID=2591470 RepID=A0A563F0A7_9PSEU|nr:winged helix DNA-binding domain-containing protein [Lentzea tibetensis]TWP53349.1 winged helix DNA-binding domain-containing protein [Lentzea tibetensis]
MTTLTRRALNRATLARQLLLERSTMPVLDAVEHLAGLQSQTVKSWYTGMWSRLEAFDPHELSAHLTERRVVRMALMRSTIHLVTAEDARWLRPLVDPPIERTTMGAFGRHLKDLDKEALVKAGRALVEEQPITFTELGKSLEKEFHRDPAALAQAIRMWVPLVQTPPRGTWTGSGLAKHTSMENWLHGGPVTEPTETLVTRYLRAFGPATVKDAQQWSGVTRLKEVFARMSLVTFTDEQGRELFDLPDAPRPHEETPAPPRFLYDFDNLLLSHADRSRIVSDSYDPVPLIKINEQPNALLVDGFTKGMWKVTNHAGIATLAIHTFGRLPKNEADQVRREGSELLSFLHSQQRQQIELTFS